MDVFAKIVKAVSNSYKKVWRGVLNAPLVGSFFQQYSHSLVSYNSSVGRNRQTSKMKLFAEIS